MNFYIMPSLEMASSPFFKATLVHINSSSQMKMPFTAHQRKGTEGTFPSHFPFLSLGPPETLLAPDPSFAFAQGPLEMLPK